MSTSEAAILGIVALFAGVVAAIIALVALSSKGR